MGSPWKRFWTQLPVGLLAVFLPLAAVHADAPDSYAEVPEAYVEVEAETHLVFLPFTQINDEVDDMGNEDGLENPVELPEEPSGEAENELSEGGSGDDSKPDNDGGLANGNDGEHDGDEGSNGDNIDMIQAKFTYCPDMKSQEIELVQKMGQDLRQQRMYLHCDLILAQVARDRAEDMGRREYVDHQTPEELGPNEHVIAAGYPLPEDYGDAPGANNIESLAAGPATVDAVWRDWIDSSDHWQHLLGLELFYAEQVNYGIAYFYLPDSPYVHYWVVLTAPPVLD